MKKQVGLYVLITVVLFAGASLMMYSAGSSAAPDLFDSPLPSFPSQPTRLPDWGWESTMWESPLPQLSGGNQPSQPLGWDPPYPKLDPASWKRWLGCIGCNEYQMCQMGMHYTYTPTNDYTAVTSGTKTIICQGNPREALVIPAMLNWNADSNPEWATRIKKGLEASGYAIGPTDYDWTPGTSLIAEAGRWKNTYEIALHGASCPVECRMVGPIPDASNAVSYYKRFIRDFNVRGIQAGWNPLTPTLDIMAIRCHDSAASCQRIVEDMRGLAATYKVSASLSVTPQVWVLDYTIPHFEYYETPPYTYTLRLDNTFAKAAFEGTLFQQFYIHFNLSGVFTPAIFVNGAEIDPLTTPSRWDQYNTLYWWDKDDHYWPSWYGVYWNSIPRVLHFLPNIRKD